MTQLLQMQWECQKDRRNKYWHGREKRPTKFVASMYIKTTFDVARQKRVTKIRRDQDVHGWITGALSRETTELEGNATFAYVESKWKFTRCIYQGSVEVPTL